MSLTDANIRAAKPGENPCKLTDGEGLVLSVSTGAKSWRLQYRFGGKQKNLTLGPCPAVSFQQARKSETPLGRGLRTA